MIVTSADMYTAFLQFLNKEKTGTIYPDEFEVLINAAQMNVIKNRYDKVEGTQKRIDDLREIMVLGEIITNTGANTAGGEIFLLPYNANANVITPKNPSGDNRGYLFMLSVGLKIQYVNDPCFTGISSTYLKCKPMSADKRREVQRDPFNKPTDQRLYYEISGNQFGVLTGGQSYGVETNCDYLRYPRDIKVVGTPVDCELALHIRQEIVDTAVRMKLEQIESPRFQSNSLENRNTIV
jgi:hypothetical protein